MPHRYARLRAKLPDHAADVVDRLDLVVHEINLPAALEFVIDRFANQLLVEKVAFGSDRLAVGRRGRDDRQVAS